jgi:hypothetical protein
VQTHARMESGHRTPTPCTTSRSEYTRVACVENPKDGPTGKLIVPLSDRWGEQVPVRVRARDKMYSMASSQRFCEAVSAKVNDHDLFQVAAGILPHIKDKAVEGSPIHICIHVYYVSALRT